MLQGDLELEGSDAAGVEKFNKLLQGITSTMVNFKDAAGDPVTRASTAQPNATSWASANTA
jgi:hypothetical protein